MKKPRPDGLMNGPNGLKAFAKDLVHMFSLGPEAARFSVVSFAANATTRVPWSYDASVIDAGIDLISPDGATSISDGFEVARQLLLTPRESFDGRDAAKIVLFLSDGEQTVDAAPDMTELETALAAAATVKSLPATVFAWGFGDQLKLTTLEGIASDPTKANPNTVFLAADGVAGLRKHLKELEGYVC
eukprot:scaffold7809_cov67-Phaeocystis_antarctica.AAC.1